MSLNEEIILSQKKFLGQIIILIIFIISIFKKREILVKCIEYLLYIKYMEQFKITVVEYVRNISMHFLTMIFSLS